MGLYIEGIQGSKMVNLQVERSLSPSKFLHSISWDFLSVLRSSMEKCRGLTANVSFLSIFFFKNFDCAESSLWHMGLVLPQHVGS